MRLPRTFDALRERNFALFYGGLICSLTGTWMERAALQWLIYRLTGDSALWLGLAVGVSLVPALLLSIPAGALADRVDLRRLLLTTQTLMMLGAGGMATLVLSGAVRPWHILVYAVWASALFTVDAPARHAFVVRLVGRERITNAFALNAVAFQLAQVAGYSTFGVLLAVLHLDEGVCLALNYVSYTFVLASLVAIGGVAKRETDGSHGGHPLEGLRHALRAPVIRAALLLSVGTAMFGFQVGPLLPVYAKTVFAGGADAFAWLQGARGVGAFVGGVVLATRSATVLRGRLVLTCGLAMPPFLILFAHAPGFWVAVGLIVVIGFVMIQSHSACSSMIQTQVPEALRGRVSSLFTMTVLVSFPLGGLLGGLCAWYVGAPLTTTASALVMLAIVAGVHLTHPEFRRAR